MNYICMFTFTNANTSISTHMFIEAFGKTIQTKVAILLSSDLAVSAVNGWQVTSGWISTDLAAFRDRDSPTASTMDLFKSGAFAQPMKRSHKYGFQRFRKWQHTLFLGEMDEK